VTRIVSVLLTVAAPHATPSSLIWPVAFTATRFASCPSTVTVTVAVAGSKAQVAAVCANALAAQDRTASAAAVCSFLISSSSQLAVAEGVERVRLGVVGRTGTAVHCLGDPVTVREHVVAAFAVERVDARTSVEKVVAQPAVESVVAV